MNVLLVTHSPFLLSDLPKENVLLLDENHSGKRMKTFGANIYDLLKNGFFLEAGLGEFARSKIIRVFQLLEEQNLEKRKENYEFYKSEIDYISEQVGDEYISRKIKRLISDISKEEKKNYLRSRIAELQEELSRIN